MYQTFRTELMNPDDFRASRFESDGVLSLHGEEIAYHTVSEDNVFCDESGKTVASIYTYSYFRTRVKSPATRPVIFGFSGGPGSSSMYVHAGFWDTKRLSYANVDRETSRLKNIRCISVGIQPQKPTDGTYEPWALQRAHE